MRLGIGIIKIGRKVDNNSEGRLDCSSIERNKSPDYNDFIGSKNSDLNSHIYSSPPKISNYSF